MFHIHAHQCPYPRHHPPAHEVGAPTLWVVTLADTCRYDGTCHTISLADALGVSCEKRWLGSYLQYLGLYPMHHHYRHGHIRAVVSLQNSFFAEKEIPSVEHIEHSMRQLISYLTRWNVSESRGNVLLLGRFPRLIDTHECTDDFAVLITEQSTP